MKKQFDRIFLFRTELKEICICAKLYIPEHIRIYIVYFIYIFLKRAQVLRAQHHQPKKQQQQQLKQREHVK